MTAVRILAPYNRGRELPAGTYYCRARSGGLTALTKVVLLR